MRQVFCFLFFKDAEHCHQRAIFTFPPHLEQCIPFGLSGFRMHGKTKKKMTNVSYTVGLQSVVVLSHCYSFAWSGVTSGYH